MPRRNQRSHACAAAPAKRRRASMDAPGPSALTLCGPPTILPTGDGSFLVRPGRLLQKVTPLQFARHFGVVRNTVYHWIDTGTIAPKYVELAGPRKLLIHAEAVADCAAKFRMLRE